MLGGLCVIRPRLLGEFGGGAAAGCWVFGGGVLWGHPVVVCFPAVLVP